MSPALHHLACVRDNSAVNQPAPTTHIHEPRSASEPPDGPSWPVRKAISVLKRTCQRRIQLNRPKKKAKTSPPTSRVKDSTTSDLERVFSSSWPMSMMEVLWPRFNFCSLNSPPLDTGMLSRLAIRRLTDDRSSSTYMASISLDINLGNLPPC